MTVDELREALGASRVILRLERRDAFFPVVAESAAPGVRRLMDEEPLDFRRASTFLFVERELRPLVQNDCLVDEPVPPPEILDYYGVRSQVLAPVVRDGRLAGIVGVHRAEEPHTWREDELALIERAARAACWQLELEELLRVTGASRTTLRAESDDAYFPLVVEVLAPGVPSLREASFDLRGAPTMEALLHERRTLVQDDVAAAPTAPPPELIAAYGVRSQVLVPIVRDGRLVAFVSVHDATRTRRWSEEEVAAAERAAARIAPEIPTTPAGQRRSSAGGTGRSAPE